MNSLNILSGGAAHGLVASLAPAFKAKTGFDIKANSARSAAWRTSCAMALPPTLLS